MQLQCSHRSLSYFRFFLPRESIAPATRTYTHTFYVGCGLSHILIGERSEPHTYRTVGKNLRHIYIYVFYIYIYIYTSVRRARAVNARATRKRRTGRLRFNGQYNRLENGYFSSKL